MLDELFRDHASGGFQACGQRFILSTEDAASPDRFAHLRGDGGLGPERITGHARERIQRNRRMIGVERGVGADGVPPPYLERRGASDGRLPEGRVEKGFEKHARQIGDDSLRVDLAGRD